MKSVSEAKLHNIKYRTSARNVMASADDVITANRDDTHAFRQYKYDGGAKDINESEAMPYK